MSTLFSIGAMNQLGDALQQACFTPSDITALRQYKNLNSLKDLINGRARLEYPDVVIDTNYLPKLPSEYSIINHEKHGKKHFSKDRLDTFFFLDQKEGDGVLGAHILGILRPAQRINISVADYLLKNVHLIPDAWRPYKVCFWGTLIKVQQDPSVLFLLYNGAGWHWGTRSISQKFTGDYPAASVLKKA